MRPFIKYILIVPYKWFSTRDMGMILFAFKPDLIPFDAAKLRNN